MVSQINARPRFSDKHLFLSVHTCIVFSLLVTLLFPALTALASVPENRTAAVKRQQTPVAVEPPEGKLYR